jgi:hypothetical protein
VNTMPLKSLRRRAYLKQVEENIAELERVRPLVNESGRIEEFARLYMLAYMAKLRLMR